MLKNIKQQILLFSVVLTAGFLCFLAVDFFFPMAKATELKKFSQLVVDKNGRPLRAFADNQGVWRYPTKHSQVSENYLQALINYEDREFWRHHGINPFSLLRAVGQLVTNGKAISGGSTLTMQVARILEPHSKSIPGKLWQMFRAFQLEFYLDKTEILDLYLNYAPFGGPIEGIEAATYTYLGKSAKEMTDAESALMAVLPQSPTRFRPDRHPERAEKARNKVLDRLMTYHIWSKEKVAQAKLESVYAEFNSRPLVAPLLARRLVKQFPNKRIIRSTIDIDLQMQMADQVKAYLSRFSESTSASALLVDNQSLEVLAYVGAGDFANKKRFGHIDMNRAIRSPGSTLKPFIYAMAMDKQLIHSESLLQDVPLHFAGYSPKNFTRQFAGPISTSKALQQSLNIPAVQVLSHLGAENFAGQLENAGLNLYFPGQSRPSLSLALGGVGVKLEELVAAYRSLAAEGLSGKLRYLQDSVKQETYLISKESAWIIGDILSKVPLLSGRPGFHRSSIHNKGLTKTSNRWVAHKTGTSYGHRDAWMVAVTAKYSLAIWIGKPDGTPSPGEFGRKTAAPLVRKILNSLAQHSLRQQAYIRPKRPAEVDLQSICWPLGTLESSQPPVHCLQSKQAWLIKQVAPKTLTQQSRWQSNPIMIEVDPINYQRVYSSCYQGQKLRRDIAVWPARLELWLPPKWRIEGLIPELHQNCRNKIDITPQLIVMGLENGSRITSPPNAVTPFEINLTVSAGQGDIIWLKNGQLIGQSQLGESFIVSDFQKGHQKIMVFDQSGNSGSVEFEVL